MDYQADGDAFVASKPREWSPAEVQVGTTQYWALDPTGERVVLTGPTVEEGAGPPKVAYLLHFFDELRRKVPLQK